MVVLFDHQNTSITSDLSTFSFSSEFILSECVFREGADSNIGTPPAHIVGSI